MRQNGQGLLQMQAIIERYKRKFDDREQALKAMTDGNIRAMAENYGLPGDLNRSQRIKYILRKEFPVR